MPAAKSDEPFMVTMYIAAGWPACQVGKKSFLANVRKPEKNIDTFDFQFFG